eukprot:CAMPEP_0201521752 /NCGR_PEP_ID=MMETSP0161_2-20130828/16012_1 /ASSEMBLY_ACC=CAM_ASM_000251 /TAXON_ID=180227 /ORGANISM="Neoparamoeba aestuarina, Strain SoJaBio B1-5/56/2" /LENGTH=144 /DNA_ID=CAMNT_0047920451 /DNA_START=142 /DNA_END=576 /DNA_ORIENTATION=+
MKFTLFGFVAIVALVAVIQTQPTIPPTTPSEPKIAFNDANACLKAISCFQYLGYYLIPRTSQDTDNLPWATDRLQLTSLGSVSTLPLALDPPNATDDPNRFCDSPYPYVNVNDCLDAPGTNNGYCLENFLAQIDACINSFLSLS